MSCWSEQPSETRSGPCTAILGRGYFFLVDVGPGTYRSCHLIGLPLGRLTAVLLTHFHSDHIGELGEVMTFSWIGGRDTKLPVYGPPGIDKVVAGFAQAYEMDGGYRVQHHSPHLDQSCHGFDTRPFALPSHDNSNDSDASVMVLQCFSSGLTVKAFEVDHSPVRPAVGFLFELAGCKVVVSGDTRRCPSLLSNSSQADVLVLDALCCDFLLLASRTFQQCSSCSPSQVEGKANPRPQEGLDLSFQARVLQDITEYHCGVQDCLDIAALVKPQLLLLTHMVPAPDNPLMRQIFLAGLSYPEVMRRGATRMLLGEDGLVVQVQQGRVTTIQSSWRSARKSQWWGSFFQRAFWLLLFILSLVFAVHFKE
mmetsp:Transcript_388/g.562  ORF Transcript_388/g.562 Transcript_388/m.562 type:complete len:367 (+) Transcript_388:170-1270(+)